MKIKFIYLNDINAYGAPDKYEPFDLFYSGYFFMISDMKLGEHLQKGLIYQTSDEMFLRAKNLFYDSKAFDLIDVVMAGSFETVVFLIEKKTFPEININSYNYTAEYYNFHICFETKEMFSLFKMITYQKLRKALYKTNKGETFDRLIKFKNEIA